MMRPFVLLAQETASSAGFARLAGFARANWTILLTCLVGFLAIYFLLPRARRGKPALGALFGAAALILAGWHLIAVDGPLPESVLFYAFAGIAVFSGGLMISQKNPVHSALSFALVVLSTCGIFLLNAAPFLMAATIIIYAGAIVVTFLFVIMLAQQAGVSEADQRSREPFLASLAGFVLIGGLLCVLHKTYENRELDGLLEQMRQVSRAKTSQEVKDLLGDPDTNKRLPIEEKLTKKGFEDRNGELLNLEKAWSKMDLADITDRARKVWEEGQRVRMEKSSLTPSEALPLSINSGARASDPLVSTQRLPANNVAAIGKSLFTDYLVAVELAGMLLLVATIGAIAIAGRRAGALR